VRCNCSLLSLALPALCYYFITARSPSCVTNLHLVRLSDVSEVRLLTAVVHAVPLDFPSPSSTLLLLYHCSQCLARVSQVPHGRSEDNVTSV
jgi:hypothetical protein